jgi:hypothetical protein
MSIACRAGAARDVGIGLEENVVICGLGALVHARGRTWGQLIFQDLFKKEQ